MRVTTTSARPSPLTSPVSNSVAAPTASGNAATALGLPNTGLLDDDVPDAPAVETVTSAIPKSRKPRPHLTPELSQRAPVAATGSGRGVGVERARLIREHDG